MTGQELKQVLQDGGRVYGTMVTLTRNPRWMRVLGQVGLDYVIVDTEHSPFSRGEVADFLAALKAAGVVPMMRVPIPDPHYITMARDAGADGILAPYVESPDQVRDVVGAAKWRPLKGALLDQAVGAHEFPNPGTKAYLEEWNKDGIVMIGIESTPAIDNLEAILDVPGIDCIFVGPHDLSVTLGVPEQYTSPAFEQALDRILKTSEARGVPVAAHFMDLELAAKWIKAGVRFVLHTSDVLAMATGFESQFSTLRDAAGEHDQAATGYSETV